MQPSERGLPDPGEIIRGLEESFRTREPLPESMSAEEIADRLIADLLTSKSGEVVVNEPASQAEMLPEDEKPRTLDDYVEIFLLTAIPEKPQKTEDREIEDLPRLFSLYQRANAHRLRTRGDSMLAQQLVDFPFEGLVDFGDKKRQYYVDLYDVRDDNLTLNRIAHWERITRVTRKAYELKPRNS